MPRARSGALLGVARALADGEIALDPGADRDETSARLLALAGIGPWTVAYIRMRALGDPDAFLPTDLGVRKGMDALGAKPGADEAWRPWRSYALQHLWTLSAKE